MFAGEFASTRHRANAYGEQAFEGAHAERRRERGVRRRPRVAGAGVR